MKKESKKGAGGRPKIKINYNIVDSLANIMCTQDEIASALDISVRTLQRDDEFCRIYKKAMDAGKKSLRRIQYDLAENGNPTMAIWLGKQYLQQRDKQEVDLKSASPLIYNITLAKEDPKDG